ncbi:hypothetical protein GCM10009113_22470 [Marinobacter szutsaonensis]
MPTHAKVLPGFPGQILQVVTRQGRLGTVQPQKTDFHLVGRMLMLRRERRHHITAGKAQTRGGGKPDALLTWFVVPRTLQIITVVPVNQVHQLKKTVSPRIAQNGFQPGYISGC